MTEKANKLQEAATCLVEDLHMLMDGTWAPDADSCQASIDNAVLLSDAMPHLLKAVELLKMAAHALETPGDFSPEELQEQVIGDIGNFLSRLEELTCA